MFYLSKQVEDIFLRGAGLICVAIWTYLAWFRGGFWRLREPLPAAPRTSSAAHVTAVIPARDEEAHIAAAVRSLRAQSHRNLTVVVVDDESSDRTAAEAQDAGADSVFRTTPRPAGWKGKLWAVSEGIRRAGGNPDYYLLTDADIEHQSPELLQALLAKAESGFDLVSVMVWLRCESPAERWLIPAFVFFFFLLYPPKWVMERPGVAAAAGGCMLIRADALRRCGGIKSIREALIDDCALARRVKANGGRVWLGVSDLAIRSIREYGRAADIRVMIARSAFAQLRHSTLLLAGTSLGLLITYLLPVLLIFPGDPIAAALGAASWLLSAWMFTPLIRAFRAPRLSAFALPAISLFYLFATVESAFRYWSGHGGTWKGRVQDSSAPR